jgi:hypothetical protein
MYIAFVDVGNATGYDSSATCGAGSTPCFINSSSASTTTVAGNTITPSTAHGVVLGFANQDFDTMSAISVGNFSADLEVCPTGNNSCAGSGTGTGIYYVSSGFEQDGGLFVDYYSSTAAIASTWTIANTQSTGIGAYFNSVVAVKQ